MLLQKQAGLYPGRSHAKRCGKERALILLQSVDGSCDKNRYRMEFAARFNQTSMSNPREHIKTLIPEVFPKLWRYCLALTSNSDRANDLAQAACLRAMEKSHLFEMGTYFDRWIFTIAQRLWFNELRSDAVRRGGGLVTIDEIDLPDTNNDPEANLFARQVLLQVMELPEAQRATVMLVYVEGFSYAEAAEILEIPIGTVMSRLSAARTKLSAKNAEDGKIDGKANRIH